MKLTNHLSQAWEDDNYKTIKYNRDYKNVDSFLLAPQIDGYPTVKIKAFEATFMSTSEFDFSQEYFGLTAIARKGARSFFKYYLYSITNRLLVISQLHCLIHLSAHK